MKKIIIKYLNLSSGKQFSFIIFLSLIGLAIEILFKEIAIAQFLKVTRIPILVLGSLSSTLMIFRIFKKSKVDLKKKIEIKKKGIFFDFRKYNYSVSYSSFFYSNLFCM